MKFEIYEDGKGEYRWRVRSSGEITADSGEGYSSKDGAREAVERVRGYAPEADLIELEESSFEVYEDEADEWRWRLKHRNGNVLGDSAEGYSSKGGARKAVKRLKQGAGDAETEET